MKLVLDISYWDMELTQQNWDTIKRGVDGVVVRGGYANVRDSYAQIHINNAKARGLPYGMYWYIYCAADINLQAQAIINAVNDLKPSVFWMDVEDVDVKATTQIAAYYKKLRELIGAKLTIPKGCYSGDWYLSQPGFAGQLSWVKDGMYWSAEYMAWYEAAWWAAFKAKFGIFDISKMQEVAQYAGIHQGIMRQLESKVPVAGLPSTMDWNCIEDVNFYKLFTNGSATPPPLPEVQAYIVSPLIGVNIRKTPSTSGVKITAIPYKTIVNIRTGNVTAGWGQVADGQWVGGWIYLANMKAV